jgi:hypothetical protein
MAARRTRQALLGRYNFLVRRTRKPTGSAILSSLELPEAFRPALGGLLATPPSKVDGGAILRFRQNSEKELPARRRLSEFFYLTEAIKGSKKDITYSFCVLA